MKKILYDSLKPATCLSGENSSVLVSLSQKELPGKKDVVAKTS